ncbi:MAG: hypothetical protein ACJ74W_01140 [Pyrinomonadaceae bacterium]
MPLPVDTIILRKLVIGKQLYQQAVIQAARRNASGRIISIIGFDLSTETVLRVVIGAIDPSKTPANDFQGLIQQADILLSGASFNPVPNKAQIQSVHTLRNDAQHKAKYPNDPDISASRIYTRDFLQAIINDIWGLAFDQISLAELIQNSEVREHLLRAEKALDVPNYQTAVQESAYGLNLAINLIGKAVVGPEVELPTPVGNIYNVLYRMREALLYSALGMNYGDYVRYRRIAGGVTFNADSSGKLHPQGFGMKENVDANDAEFVVSYSIDAVLEIEERVGGFDLGTIDGWY